MPDDDLDLHRLAPTVDTEHARAGFHRRRLRSKAYRRGALAAAAVSVLVVGTVAGLALSEDDTVRTIPGDGVSTDAIEFEVLGVVWDSADDPGLRAATDVDTYAGIWSKAEGAEVLPLVDFDEHVVVSVTLADACDRELKGFVRSGDTVTPEFESRLQDCFRVTPKTFVAALERGELEPRFTLLLPADGLRGVDEQRLDVELSAPTEGGPTCDAIEQFAEQINDVGISYDYDASASPEELMDTVDVAFSGVLDGDFSNYERGEDGRSSFRVLYGVRVDQVFKAPAAGDLGTAPDVTIEVAPGLDLDPFEEVATAGIPVVVLGHTYSVGSDYDAAIEGLVTACPGGPLLGRVGIEPGWTEIDTLDDLIARLEATDP